MLEKSLFFALGYYMGSRGTRDGLADLVGLVKSVAGSEEFSSAAGMAASTVKLVVDRGTGRANAPSASERDWWEAAIR